MLTRFRLRFYATIKLFWSGVILAVLMVICPLSEASMQVSPTQIFIAAERNAAGVTLRNTDDAPLHAQIRVFEWRQQNGEDQLLPTHTIVASPPMLKLTPGVNQLVRIVRNGVASATTESSYRIIIDEMPVKSNTANQTTDQTSLPPGNGLQFRLRYSLPVFVAPSKQITVQPILNTQLIKDKDAYFLQISNEGNGHAHIADITWIHNEQRLNIASGLAGYVLPGQHRQWLLPDKLNLSNGGVFTAKINGELLERVLTPVTN